MTEVTLRCLSAGSARTVAAEADRPGDGHHRARAEGTAVVITYYDARYPLNVAEWAFNNGHADDSAAGDVIQVL